MRQTLDKDYMMWRKWLQTLLAVLPVKMKSIIFGIIKDFCMISFDSIMNDIKYAEVMSIKS